MLASEHRPARGREDGFAAVDALVALTILSTTVALALGASAIARRAAFSAAHTTAAERLLRGLTDRGFDGAGLLQGHDGDFSWTVEDRPVVGAEGRGSARLCLRSAEATALRDRRHFALSTIVPCVGITSR